MAHQRKLIRQAVVALLAGANTAAGARVQGTRIEPHKKSQLPAISVYTLNEEVSEYRAPRELTRTLKLEIAAWVMHSDAVPVDDAMDDIAAAIEDVMSSDWYLSKKLAVSAVDPAADTLTIASHGLSTGDGPLPIISSGALPGSLVPGFQYHAIVVDDNTIKLAKSLDDALDGTIVDITDAGSGAVSALLSTAADSILESTEMAVVEDDARSDPLVGIVTLTYSVTYRTTWVDPNPLASFVTISAQHQIVGATATTPAAIDQFTLET